ncbi:MAG: DEAD/DEAH box helicase [Beijerinckiaceae bacterium]
MTSLPIPAPLAKALADKNYTELTAVQQAVLAPEAAERDLLVSAQTGSGKTVAFGIGIGATLLLGDNRMEPPADPLALIVAPTRELAMQVQRELEWLYAPTGARVIACVGGMDPRRERRLLDSGAHIVVGTPGRLKDHIERKSLRLGDIRAVVLDEADEMLDLGFRDDLEFILQTTPETRRTLLFSATLPRGIVALAGKYQKDAFRIAAAAGDRGHADIEYRALRVHPKETEHAIVNVLRQVNSPATLIFCNTRDATRHFQATLVERGFSAVYLSGELSQNERNQSLQALRDGRARICVATDVAARGIDLPNLDLVIHADLPLNAEILQHRSGRTGRAGRKGISVLVIAPSRRRKAERLIIEAKLKPQWMDPPSADDIRALDRQRFLQDPLLTEETSDEDRAMAELVLKEKTPEEIAAILAKLYRSRLPEPEELSGPESLYQPRSERNFERDKNGKGDKSFEARRSPDRGDRPPRGRSERQESPERRERSERPERNERFDREPAPLQAQSDSVIFRMDIGRNQKADPKWLLPMICRRGNVTRNEIGTIRIFEDITEFEINRDAAEHFGLHARRKDGDDILITPGDEPRQPGTRKPSFAANRDFPKKDFAKKDFRKRDDDSARPARDSGSDYGDRPPHSAKPAFSDKPSYSDKPAFARKPKREWSETPPSVSDEWAATAPRAGKSHFDKKPPFEKKAAGKAGAYAKKAPARDFAKPFGKGPKSTARSGFSHRKKDT